MGERTQVKFNEGADQWLPNNTFRKELSDTYLDKVLAKVASEHAEPYNTVDALKKISPTGTDAGVYYQIYKPYHELLGDRTETYPESNVIWEIMEFEQLRTNFSDPTGMQKFVNDHSTAISGEIMAIQSGVTGVRHGSGENLVVALGQDKEEIIAQANAYRDAHLGAQLAAGTDPAISKKTNVADIAIADFKEQCFMLAHIFKFCDYKMNNVELVERKGLPYYGASKNEENTNQCLMVHGEPYGFMNKLTQYGTQSTLLNLKSHEISGLVPKIRLFKVFEDDEGDEISQEIHFDAFPNENSIEFAMKDRRKRGVGVGISDFTFSYEGNNPFAVKKSIKANLTLYAASFDELFRSRGGITDSADWRYVDLALKTGGANIQQQLDATKGSVEYENLSRLNFRIKAVVGWQNPSGQTGMSNTELSRAINNSFVTLNLTPTIHNFDIQDDGSVRFNVQYYAYIESHFDNQLFSIFGNERTFARFLKRKLIMSSLSADCKSESIAPIKEAHKDEVRDDLREDAAEIITQLMTRQKLRYVNIPHSKLRSLNMEGPYSELGKDFSKAVTNPNASQVAAIERLLSGANQQNLARQSNRILNIGAFSTRPVSGGNNSKYNLAFFYVSDLFDIILRGIDERLASADKVLSELRNDSVSMR